MKINREDRVLGYLKNFELGSKEKKRKKGKKSGCVNRVSLDQRRIAEIKLIEKQEINDDHREQIMMFMQDPSLPTVCWLMHKRMNERSQSQGFGLNDLLLELRLMSPLVQEVSKQGIGPDLIGRKSWELRRNECQCGPTRYLLKKAGNPWRAWLQGLKGMVKCGAEIG
ncbi:hypothetical protein M426DRAFT_261644 [Hypoxylon sp. CI-4A]|nr:hypothetical protein M426DRAFT_261644 [Hypoxylon sp. CI-4A]